MPSTTKSIEAEAFEAVRATPFTKIHGRPTRNDYETLKKEVLDLASELEDITYDWTRSPTGKEYGLLAEIIGKDEYQHLTNLTWVQETEPGPYDPDIDDTTPTHARKRMEQEWERGGKRRPSGKDSFAGSQLICAKPWMRTGTHK